MTVAIKKIISSRWRIIYPGLAGRRACHVGRQASARRGGFKTGERRWSQMLARGILGGWGRERTVKRARWFGTCWVLRSAFPSFPASTTRHG